MAPVGRRRDGNTASRQLGRVLGCGTRLSLCHFVRAAEKGGAGTPGNKLRRAAGRNAESTMKMAPERGALKYQFSSERCRVPTRHTQRDLAVM